MCPDKNKHTKPELLTQERYEQIFKGKKEKALEYALNIRKFEIDLYWRRASYFWTIIAVLFAGYGMVMKDSSLTNTYLPILINCLGIVFSFAWFLVNKSSKQWQENWENHVDLLEDDYIGPLYKTVFKRDEIKWRYKLKNVLIGPTLISVSKVNALISLYVFVIWTLMLLFKYSVFPFYLITFSIGIWIIILSVLVILCFLTICRTDKDNFEFSATFRKSVLKLPENNKTECK